MKIKTITCHDVYNYGASLQAYALQTYLEKQGHEVEIIDYMPDYRPRRYRFFHLNNKKGRLGKIASSFPLLEPFCALWRNKKNFKFYNRKREFDLFKKERQKVTDVCYHNVKELTSNKPEADLYIAGSDQIWNSIYDNGRDASYYCAFENDPRKCISYAASFGADHIHPDYVSFVRKELNNFKSISVRESSGKQIVESLGLNAEVVLDPVFLLDREDWESLCTNDRTGDYLLLYDFLQNDPRVKSLALRIAKERHLKIYSLNDLKTCKYADVNINNAGPIEFLEYVRGAKFVISTSFHATAFSVIWGKEFYTFPLLGHDNASRMKDFLSSIDLEDRFVEEETKVITNKIDYIRIDDLIHSKKAASRKWLCSQLNNKIL